MNELNEKKRRDLERIAAAIADGEPVDWNAARHLDAESSKTLEGLKIIGKFRDVQASSPEEVLAPQPVHRVARRAPFGWVLPAAAVVLLAITLGVVLWPGDREFNCDVAFFKSGLNSERMQPLDPVVPGDGVFLEFSATEAVHVYVLCEDQLGNRQVLFPRADAPLQNPLPADSTHRLPGGRGDHSSWTITHAGGIQHYAVIASREPLEDLEQELLGFDHEVASTTGDSMRRASANGGTAQPADQPQLTTGVPARLDSTVKKYPEGNRSTGRVLKKTFRVTSPR